MNGFIQIQRQFTNPFHFFSGVCLEKVLEESPIESLQRILLTTFHSDLGRFSLRLTKLDQKLFHFSENNLFLYSIAADHAVLVALQTLRLNPLYNLRQCPLDFLHSSSNHGADGTCFDITQ